MGISESQPTVTPLIQFIVLTWVSKNLESKVCSVVSQRETQRLTIDEFSQIINAAHYTVPAQPPIHHNISHRIKRRKEGSNRASKSIASIQNVCSLKIAFNILSLC